MRSTTLALAAGSVAQAATLNSVCSQSYAVAALPADDFYPGITIDKTSVTATASTNVSVSDVMFPDATISYCNVTFAYSHTGKDDLVHVTYWLPAPDKFQGRYLSTGGGGLAINSKSSSVSGGIVYGAASGLTDAGFGSFDNQWDSVFLLANGTINWDSVYMFGYQAIHELSIIGKEYTKQFFGMNSTKLYSYYQGCSEGGRDGWSQVQRYADEWDGAITGAPAFRYGFQQVNHLYSNAVEQTLDYYPSNCELEKIVNETIAFCDPLDGKTDGVVARTDLCKIHFNINSTVGTPYYCAATSGHAGYGPFGASSPTPAQNGTISAKGVAVASEILNGLHDSEGKRVYLSYQPAASFEDASTTYNNATKSWGLSVSSLGGEWVARYLNLVDSSTLSTEEFANVTYDTLKAWMLEGWQRYEDSLQTTNPDLTPFHKAGGKVLHYHGESDNSIPTASSVRYHESVRQIMYPNLSFNESSAALSDWYKLFLVPGAAHCTTNDLQPNGPWPQTNLAVLIDWVEKGVEPVTLNATHLAGDFVGQDAQICAWPLRPLWSGNGTTMDCVYDQESIDTWLYDFDGVKLPVY